MKTGFEDIPLAASLVYENSSEIGPFILPPQEILIIESPAVIVNGRVIARFVVQRPSFFSHPSFLLFFLFFFYRIRLNDVSMNIGNRKVCIEFQPANPAHQSLGIAKVRSQGITIM